MSGEGIMTPGAEGSINQSIRVSTTPIHISDNKTMLLKKENNISFLRKRLSQQTMLNIAISFIS